QTSDSIRRRSTESALIPGPGRDTPGALRLNGRRPLPGNTINFRIGNGARWVRSPCYHRKSLPTSTPSA
ncbi:hypothetical protein B0T20DRAFT_343296, partial [Sordaria brevicollis]